MINALIRKELRENLKLSLAGVGVFALIIASVFDKSNPPLMNDDFQTAASFFCGIFGALLGWLQIRRERHPDLRSFLLHRPMTRTGIFLGKLSAGMISYFVGASLPLIFLTILIQVPGRVAAPFEWRMTLPALAIFLGGIVCYFAGMLTALPQSRWYANRGLALGAGFLVLATPMREFVFDFRFVAIFATILGVAAWGGFVGDDFRRQPVAAKFTLPVALVPGGAILFMLIVAILVNFVLPQRPQRQTYYKVGYTLLADGTVTNLWESENGPSGMPYAMAPSTGPLLVGGGGLPGENYRDPERFDVVRSRSSTATWFYSHRYGRLLGYDYYTRKFIGSIGPEGFSKTADVPGQRFGLVPGFKQEPNQLTFATGNAIYKVDFQARTARPILTSDPGDQILASADIMTSTPQTTYRVNGTGGMSPASYSYLATWDCSVAITRQFVYAADPAGKFLLKVPTPAGFSNDTSLEVFRLSTNSEFALMLAPLSSAKGVSPGSLQIHLQYVDSGGTVLKSQDLPVFPRPSYQVKLAQKLFTLPMPPAMALFGGIVGVHLDWEWIRLAVIASVIGAVLGLLVGWRYGLTVAEQAAWFLFHLLFGLGGFLAFLCVVERPARERCPKCAKWRRVDRELCEHCGSEFAPAEKNGTEIFETLGSGEWGSRRVSG